MQGILPSAIRFSWERFVSVMGFPVSAGGSEYSPACVQKSPSLFLVYADTEKEPIVRRLSRAPTDTEVFLSVVVVTPRRSGGV